VRSHRATSLTGVGPGVGFVAATALLAACATALTLYPSSGLAFAAAAFALAGLLASYVLATTTGLPILHPEPEAVDGLGLATKAIEAAGLLTAVATQPRVEGMLTWTRHGPTARFLSR
jgi:hypothetical protein